MKNDESELKAVAKAVGASLKRAGHQVPHSAVLDALSAALNKRNWNVLKASLQATAAAPATTIEPQAAAPQRPQYSDRTWFYLRLAHALGKPVNPVPPDDKLALAAAITACGPTLDGLLKWEGWNLPATLTFQTARVDAGNFVPEQHPTVGSMAFRLKSGIEVHIEVACQEQDGWYVTSQGSQMFFEQMEKALPESLILPALPPAATSALPAEDAYPMVKASFWTDDRTFEVEFNARPYLREAPEQALTAIFEVGFVGDQCTDWVAEFVSDKGLNSDLQDAFAYLAAVNKGRRKETIGFECEVDREDYLRWMDANRRLVLARMLCQHAGVRFEQAQEAEIKGMWDWLADEKVCDRSHATEDEAILDAYEQLGLLQQALDDMV